MLASSPVSASVQSLNCGEAQARIALITGINDGEAVRHRLMNGEIPAALINASVIVDAWQIQIAAFKAWTSASVNKLSTRTLHSEIIYNLLPSKQISMAFKHFGMQANDTACVAVTIGPNCDADMLRTLQSIPSCLVMPFAENIQKFLDINKVKQIYKITELELTVGTLSDAVCGRIAACDCLS